MLVSDLGVDGGEHPDTPPRRMSQSLPYYFGAARAEATLIAQRLTRHWRRSLQLRIVALTVAIATAVVGIVGYIVITQIATGLLNTKIRAAIAQSTTGVDYLHFQMQLQSGQPGGNTGLALENGVANLQQRTSSAGLFEVMAIQRDADGNPQRIVQIHGLTVTDLPVDLQHDVRGGKQARSYARINLDGTEQSVLIVGSAVPSVGDDVELYYLFPLQGEQQTLTSITRTTLLAGLALIVLIAGVGLLISRLVVLPVRQAADTAWQLAGGDLERRMTVRGDDDLARLAHSYNEMAESLSSQIGRLEALSKVQQRFTSDVSHELRTPLTTVRMAAELLYDYREDFPEASRRSAELLYEELDRFEVLLKDLLEISRHDAGNLRLEAEPTDLTGLLRRVIDGAAAVAEERGCELRLTAPEEPVEVELNGRRIERVLRNLVHNALEHGAGQPVEVTVAQGPTAVAVTVRDHGVGIDQTAAEHLFDRFWRADPARERKLGGTGLGMAISLEDVRLHNGWIQVWGIPGEGANFRVTLPIRADERVVESPLPLVPRGQVGGSLGGYPRLRSRVIARGPEGQS